MSAVYDQIGHDYDITRRADPYLATRMADLLELKAHGRYLDLACGTGNYTLSLASRAGTWTGVDASATMIAQAREKAPQVNWQCAPAEQLSAADASYDGVLCSLALHHLSDLSAACREVRRVLSRGTFVILTSSPEQMRRYWLNAYFPTTMARSISQMPELSAVTKACLQAGFRSIEREPYFVRPDLADGFLYVGKHRPEIYLSEKVRAGSSTFRTLADPEEVRTGCARLAEDLSSGRFRDVFAEHENDLGDYLFLRVST